MWHVVTRVGTQRNPPERRDQFLPLLSMTHDIRRRSPCQSLARLTYTDRRDENYITYVRLRHLGDIKARREKNMRTSVHQAREECEA